jgi:hypothetical protein
MEILQTPHPWQEIVPTEIQTGHLPLEQSCSLFSMYIYLSYACDSAVCTESLLSAAFRHFYVSNPLCPWHSFRSRSHLRVQKAFRSATSMTGPTSFVRGEGVCACLPLCLDCFLHLSPVSSVLWVEWSIGWTAARAGVYLTHTNNLLQLSGQRQAVWGATEACKRHSQLIAIQLIGKFHTIRRSCICGSLRLWAGL